MVTFRVMIYHADPWTFAWEENKYWKRRLFLLPFSYFVLTLWSIVLVKSVSERIWSTVNRIFHWETDHTLFLSLPFSRVCPVFFIVPHNVLLVNVIFFFYSPVVQTMEYPRCMVIIKRRNFILITLFAPYCTILHWSMHLIWCNTSDGLRKYDNFWVFKHLFNFRVFKRIWQ